MDQKNLLIENTKVFAEAMCASIRDMVGVELESNTESICEGLFQPNKGMTVMIHFTGPIQGEYAISIEEQTVASWIGCYQEGMSWDELKSMRSDYVGFLKEALNTTVGSAINNLSNDFSDLTFLPPIVVFGELEYPSVPCGIIKLGKDQDLGTCFFVLNMMGLELGDKLQAAILALKESANEAAQSKRNIEGMLTAFPAGLLIIGKDGKVQPGFSYKTPMTVGLAPEDPVAGEPIIKVLGYDQDSQIEAAFSPWLDLAFGKYHTLGPKTLKELFPIEERKNSRGKILHSDIVPLLGEDGNPEALMLIVEDYTEKRRIEKEMTRLDRIHEQNMEMMTQIVNLEADEISEFLFDSSGLLSEAKKNIRNSQRDKSFIDSLYRSIHTLKGNSGQFHFKSLQQLAAEIEKDLARLRNADELERRNLLESFNFERIGASLDEADGYLQKLEELQTRLGSKDEKLGSKAERSEPAILVAFPKIDVLVQSLRDMREIIASVTTREILLPAILQCGRRALGLREVPVANFERLMSPAVERLAKRLGKEAQFTVNGKMDIEIEAFRTLHRGLVHLVNNAMDHGIELPEIRSKSGKMVTGIINMYWTIEGSKAKMVLDDDGAGINFEAVREKYGMKYGMEGNALALIPEESLALEIFEGGFTTRSNVTDISGRGVGLDAVRHFTNQLNGTINVQSTKGKGTRFTFTFPLAIIQPSSQWNIIV